MWSEEDAGNEEGQKRRLEINRGMTLIRGFMRGHRKGYKQGFNRGFKRGVKFDNDNDEPMSYPTAAATPLDCSGIAPPLIRIRKVSQFRPQYVCYCTARPP